MPSSNKQINSNDNNIVVILYVAMVAIIGIVAGLWLESILPARLDGTIQLTDNLGAKAQVGQVEVLAFSPAVLTQFFAEKQAQGQDEKAKLAREYQECLQLSQTATGASKTTLGFVGDITMNALTLGTWSAVRGNSVRLQYAYGAEERRWRMSVWPVAGFYFDGLPKDKAFAHAATDQNGNFQLSVPKQEPFVIVARTSYAYGPEPKLTAAQSYIFKPPQKQCYWMVRTSLHGVRQAALVLSERNEMDHNSTPMPQASLFDYWK